MTTTLPHSRTGAGDELLGELIEEVSRQLEAGQAVDLDAFIAAHPERAETLRLVLPALAVLADLGRSAVREPHAGSMQDRLDGAGLGDLGDFRIIREVGRGGMGVVYEAVQISLRRRVALKVLPFAAAMDPTQLRRFQTESLAAAQLHHTNIVPVFSVGSERGVHYYAMQFIDGQTLAAVIQESRRSASPVDPHPPLRGTFSPGEKAERSPLLLGEGGRRPGEGGRDPDTAAKEAASAAKGDLRSTAWRGQETLAKHFSSTTPSSRSREYFRLVAELGIQAAEALDYAHKVGIIHRDIKPANLLVDEGGNLWITDFGLARFQEDTGLTMTGDMVGTLRYMSPEQALAKRGYLDHRTDIYSLGVTLYEVLTLRPAIDGQDRQELLRRIAQEEPTPPRRLNPSIPRELETILLKAMNKEPESRYATAQELADDLRRFLEDKPIKARRPTAWEHTVKWSRRHKTLVGSAVVVLLLTVAGLATDMVLLARKQAELERQRDEARLAVNDMYTDVAAQWLAQQAALEPMQRKFLQKALDYYQRFAGEENADPKVRLKTALAYERVGFIQEKLGQYPEAQVAYRRGMTILEKLVADAPVVPEHKSELATTLTDLGDMLEKLGHHAEGEQLLRQAIALAEKVVAASPAMPQYRSGLANSHHSLGELLESSGHFAEAEGAYRRAIALREKLAADSPAVPKYQSHLAGSIDSLASLLEETERLEEAEQEYDRAIMLEEKLVAGSPFVPQYRRDLARHLGNLGVLLHRREQHVEAEQAYRRALALWEKLAAESPTVPEYRNGLARSHNGLGVMWMIDRPSDAAQAFRRAIA